MARPVKLPVGSDREASSDFQLIAGTNRDLRVDVLRAQLRIIEITAAHPRHLRIEPAIDDDDVLRRMPRALSCSKPG